MQLKQPFTTSLGDVNLKDFYVVEVIDEEGYRGFGETAAFPTPWYTEETVETNRHVMETSLIPLVLYQSFTHPNQVAPLFEKVRRNNMAKAAVEGAIWDLYAKRKDMPLATAIGGAKQKVDVGVSIGIQPSINRLLHTIERRVAEGYKRVKLKIKPGWDVNVLEQVRTRFPDLPIMVDANSAYSLQDIDHLKQLDDFNLMMIEQPLAHDDFLEHAQLQAKLRTPICLDESIHTLNDVKMAVHIGSCKIINIKVSRVGGITVAKQIHDYCAAHNIQVWCGGMLEAGIGRAHSVALSTLPNFTLPGDTAASSNYWERDIIDPEVTMENGEITIPNRAGIGYEVDWKALEMYRVGKSIFK